jgi:hypothetical protein
MELFEVFIRQRVLQTLQVSFCSFSYFSDSSQRHF